MKKRSRKELTKTNPLQKQYFRFTKRMSLKQEKNKRRKRTVKTLTISLALTVSVAVIPSSNGFAPRPNVVFRPSSLKSKSSKRPSSKLIFSTNSKSDAERFSRRGGMKAKALRILNSNPRIQLPFRNKHHDRSNVWEQNMVLELPSDVGELDLFGEKVKQLPFTLNEFETTSITDDVQARIEANEQLFPTNTETEHESFPQVLVESSITSTTRSTSPGVLNIAKFALPAIGVWLCGPLLSLIDTAIVGLFAGTNHQAALSPAVALTDYAALLLAFLFAATTNLVSAASSNVTTNTDAHLDSSSTTTSNGSPQSTLISSLQLSTFVGTGLGLVMYACAKVLLKTLIGNDTIDPNVFQPAMQYVKIRAMGLPAAAILGSAQAACLGLKDIRSPLMILGAAAGVNLVGDLIFVRSKYALFNGAAGAAWATILSQYTAVFLFLKWLKFKPKNVMKSTVDNGVNHQDSHTNYPELAIVEKLEGEVNELGETKWIVDKEKIEVKPNHTKNIAITKNKATTKGKKTKKSSFSTRGFLYENSFKKRDVFNFPKKTDVQKYTPYVIPVTTTSVGRVSLFLAMAHVSSCCMGTIGMAAQQIILALFEAFCPVVDSLSLTAQSFIPAALKERESLEAGADDNLRTITKDFFKSGLLFGSTLVLAVSCLPMVTKFFTADLFVMQQVHEILPYLGAIFAMHGVVMSAEGVLLGRRDLNFLGWMYGFYFAAIPALMLRVKHAALSLGKAASLSSVWKIFVGYEMSRMTLWVGRALWLSRKGNAPNHFAVDGPVGAHPNDSNQETNLDAPSFNQFLDMKE